jgi:hypothetical protein
LGHRRRCRGHLWSPERDAEEDHGFEAFADEGLEVEDEFVDAAAVLVGEGGHAMFVFENKALVGWCRCIDTRP